MDQPDFVEVGRVAFELGERHGWGAAAFAANQAEHARSAGDEKEHRFWVAVWQSLRMRG
jgi:hypothetical protein